MENVEHENKAREELVAYANSIGITPEFINDLVDEFYARVRKHPSLGPIFNERIQDWDAHILKLKHFWASVCLHSGTYSGRPMPAHMSLDKAQPFHFPQWLELFEQTLTELAPSYDAVEYFMERANRIAQSLSLGMFYRP